ncbi:hypothetical protein ACQUQU_01420 [Thalassolituus sp. LLYu03]|uniref:hypothetical protein n=1 Tax=Thalassolituus sp. LLYu03 TaxID=3421656 RepID=UPI003D26DF4E
MMMNIKVLIGGFFLAFLLSGCGGSGGSGGGKDDTSDDKKTFTLSLTSVEVAKMSDGVAVTLKPSGISSSGTITLLSDLQ